MRFGEKFGRKKIGFLPIFSGFFLVSKITPYKMAPRAFYYIILGPGGGSNYLAHLLCYKTIFLTLRGHYLKAPIALVTHILTMQPSLPWGATPACTCPPPTQLTTTLRLQYVVSPGCAIGGATGTAINGTAYILLKCTLLRPFSPGILLRHSPKFS